MSTPAVSLGRVVLSASEVWERTVLLYHGLRKRTIHLPDSQSHIVCWAPKDVASACSRKPPLLLLHGFRSSAARWAPHVSSLSPHFSLFIPDLLFFGESTTSSLERSEIFQARCIHAALLSLGVKRSFVMGHSYGGFVAYRLAHLYPESVSKLIIVSSGIRMDCHNNDSAMHKTGAKSVHDLLAPTSVHSAKQLSNIVFNTVPKIPDFILEAALSLNNSNRDRHVELIDALEIGKYECPTDIPKASQKTLILWGEKDQIFDVKLAYDLQHFLGGTAELKVFEGQGHVPQLAQGFYEEVISFLSIAGDGDFYK
ncbi:hypothetical protein KP509_13G021400 [Ceratopteris richardii]|uniref:AB hydrolase-1 domain-containing protein n=1 Tax=Ceratopteris richardii TaxID=49495 RepID=A0A8T2TG61_CERRI|nr:hypothetical protein KP509_13G021400 [Ceratopteris richardii]